MRLYEFIENPRIESSEFIYLERFEQLFLDLHDGKNTFFYPNQFKPKIDLTPYLSQNHTLQTKAEILEIFKILNNLGDVNLLLLNPDVDMPMIKDEFRLSTLDHLPFNQDYQNYLDNREISDFIDQNFINSIGKNIKIFCNSIISDLDNSTMIPLGRDPKAKSLILNNDFERTKNKLCLFNCSLPPRTHHWYGRIREYIFNSLSDKNHVDRISISSNEMGSRIIDSNNYLKFLRDLSSYKFVMCPRGCGLDTYRMWDTLYFGGIPIVVRSPGHKEFEDLPIFWLDKWQDYELLSKQLLEDKWNEMVEKKYNFEILKFSYWVEKITQKIKQN